MSARRFLIAVSGWEDRFIEGAIRVLHDNNIDQVIAFDYDLSGAHLKKTNLNRQHLARICRDADLSLEPIGLFVEKPADNWHIIEQCIQRLVPQGADVIVDITTMPRETLWSIFFFLMKLDANVRFAYHKPLTYGAAWLSRDPGTPRFIYKHSGIFRMHYPTALLVATGFDSQRTLQLVHTYDPEKIIILSQSGTQFDNHERNLKAHQNGLPKDLTVETISLDSYSEDCGTSTILNATETLVHNYNVVASSLGPKLSAVALYRAWIKFPSIALSFVPTLAMNPNYSSGLGETTYGTLIEDLSA